MSGSGHPMAAQEESTMTTGRSNKLVGQKGEYLVAAELSRRGLIATTFTGNVPNYDIIASGDAGRQVSVEVKTSRGATWQFGNMTRYCDVTLDGKVLPPREAPACAPARPRCSTTVPILSFRLSYPHGRLTNASASREE